MHIEWGLKYSEVTSPRNWLNKHDDENDVDVAYDIDDDDENNINVHVGLGCQNQNLDENQEGENQSNDLWLEGEYKDDYNTNLVRWCRKNNIKTCGIIFCCYSHSNAIKVTQMSSTSTRFH